MSFKPNMSGLRNCVQLHQYLRRSGSSFSNIYRPASATRYHYTTSSTEPKLYELRTYTVMPEFFKFFLDLNSEWMHLRTSHSKLFGYWISEIGGGIHEAVHIWEYDSLSHRASVRQALGNDESWQKNFISKLMPVLQRQDNSLLQLFPGASVKEPPGKGVYQLESFTLNPAKMNETESQFLARQKTGATQLATFYTVLGVSYFGFQLWHHPTVDNLLLPAVTGDQKDESPDKGKELGVAVFQSRLMLPTSWSPMK